MKLLSRLAALAAAATITAGVLAVITPPSASAHGTSMAPGSRTFLCWKDGLTATGEIRPNNPACSAAVSTSGANSLYNWFSVLRSDAGGRTTGFIPDGQLCSGGNTGFSGYDLARTDWPLTHLTAGANFSFKYSNWAHHPGTFYFYVTKDSWSPTRPLAWGDLETPFLTVTNPPQNGSPGTNEGHYYFNGTLPTNKSGRHIIYSRWVRSDSQENFFACSDVTFDGGNGEVTGVGPGGTPPPGPTTPPPGPTTPPPGPTTPPPGPTSCMASYRVINSWSGGFQGEVTIMNHGTSSFNGWTARWAWPSGQSVGSLWSGIHTVSGTTVTVKPADWNKTIAPNGSTTFGFVANGSATPQPAVTCTSP